MKVAHAEQHVLGTGGLGEAQAFKIRTSAHAFKILSSGLYSDKIGAVLREIGCNARDAHIAGGIGQRPFLVKLPNNIDPQFFIRDHGPGLSHEEVMNLYTTYFASTKQESNDFTGAFGLGSKSPFSYTDSFTVTSCHDGKKRIYSAHIGNKGAPEVALMDTTDVADDWQTGIEVGFPVKPADFAEFGTKAQRIFQHFTPVPNVQGGKAVVALKIKEDFKSYAFTEVKESEQHTRGIIIATMGCVAYPVSIAKIRSELQKERDEITEQLCEFNNLILRFELGELQVAASREEMQYDEATTKRLVERMKSVSADLLKQLYAAYKKATAGTWADICDFKKLENALSRGVRTSEAGLKKAGINDAAFSKLCNSYSFALPALGERALSPSAYLSLLEQDSRSAHFRLRINRPLSATGSPSMDYRKDVTLVHGAADRGYARIRKAIQDGKLKGLIVAVLPKNDGDAIDTDAMVDALKKHMKGLPEVHVGTLEAPPIIRVSRKKGAKNVLPDVQVMMDNASVPVSTVPDTRKVYVQASVKSSWGSHRTRWYLDKDTPMDEYHQTRMLSYLGYVVAALPGCGLVAPVVISKQNWIQGRMRLRPEWVDFKTHVAERLSDKKNLDALSAMATQKQYTMDLDDRSDPSTVLEKLVLIREFHKAAFTHAEPVLKKHNLFDAVAKVHGDSKASILKHVHRNTEPPALANYRNLAQALNIQIKTPQYKAATLDFESDYSYSNNIPYEAFKAVAKHAPKVFPRFLENILNKGDDE